MSMQDFYRAIVVLFFIEGIVYFLFPKYIQDFAVRCLVDAKLPTLRIFGLILIGTGTFLYFLFSGRLM